MNTGRIIFSQLMDFIPKHEFNKCVRRYRGNYRVRKFSCYNQYLCMAFAQLTYRGSLREIETCLRAMKDKLYHTGIRGQVSRNTLAKANERRDWRIYADFAQILIHKARKLYAGEKFGVELKQIAYVLDSTTIDLCLSLFPWAKFRQHKAAVKLHTLMDLKGSIPCFVRISSGKMHDVKILDELLLESGAFYIMDRAYTDFTRLYKFTLNFSFFVIRAKKNLDFSRRSYRHVDKSTGLRCDQTIILRGPRSSKQYPEPLRRISYFDSETKKRFVFLTNNFLLPDLTIAQLYKCRWNIEIFFKWIKQYLKIKSFFGTSENAVKTQIWIAISVYVLVAILKKQLKSDQNLGEILQILSISLFEKLPISQAVTGQSLQNDKSDSCNQLAFIDF